MNEELIINDKVTLADGTVFPCDYLATIPQGYMFIAITSDDLASIVTAFSDKTKTAAITYGDYVLEHYTVFVSIQSEGPSRNKVMLRKAFVGEE